MKRNVLSSRLQQDRIALMQYVKMMEPEHTVDDIALIFNCHKSTVSRALEVKVEDQLLNNSNK